jgi:fatty acid desaturase
MTTGPAAQPLFRYGDGALPNLAAIAYAILGFAAGLVLLTLNNLALNLAGILLTAHALTVSAYIIHECTHGAMFSRPADNDRLGQAMSWLNGACLAPYAGLKEKHLRHHADRLDVVTFDYRAVLRAAPGWVRRLVLMLEWAYIPAVEYLMRGLVIAAQFTEPAAGRRWRVVMILALRMALFATLAYVSPKALALYAVAYLLFLHVLRFQDAFQHTFDLYATRSLAPAPAQLRRDRAYEQTNTYSDVISYGHPALNLVLLNFSYHNAHHARPAAPWHQLPKLHNTIFGADQTQVLPCRLLLRSYHKHRLARVMAEDYGVVQQTGARAENFIGAVGVSFLTAI